MCFALDHVFVTVPAGAPQMDELLAAGFREGPPNAHPGQGTACRRIFFSGLYLELLWLEDEGAASAPGAVLAGIGARAGLRPGASRLGVGLRRIPSTHGALPIDTWEYRPPYLPTGVSVAVATDSHRVEEPLIFFLPESPGRPTVAGTTHANGAHAVTDLLCTLPGGGRGSTALEWLRRSGCLRIDGGACELLSVDLDHRAQGRTLDLRPGAPVRLRW